MAASNVTDGAGRKTMPFQEKDLIPNRLINQYDLFLAWLCIQDRGLILTIDGVPRQLISVSGHVAESLTRFLVTHFMLGDPRNHLFARVFLRSRPIQDSLPAKR